jgi:hypothetical protein
MSRRAPAPAAVASDAVSAGEPKDRALPLYGAIAALGIAAAATVALTAERDPFAWGIPILAVTTVALVVLAVARGGEREMRRAAAETGLEYDGVQPVPPATPLLADLPEGASGPMLYGDLDVGGPRCRLVRVRTAGRSALMVGLTDAPDVAVDSATREWLDEHPLRPRAATEGGVLVVAVGADVSHRVLLELLREVHARMARPERLWQRG